MIRSIAAGVSMLSRAGTGDGLPLLLLHGIGSNARSWAPAMESLEPALTAIAWNAPGYGESDRLDAKRPIPAHYAERLAAMLDESDIHRVVLAGHSLGALFACRFAAAYPERVAGLAVFSPALGYKVAEGERLPAAVQARIDDLDALGPAAFAQARAGRLLFRPQTKPDVLRNVQAGMAAINPAGYAQAVWALGAGDLLADAARVTAPSLVATGGEDGVTPPANAHAAHEALRSTSPVVIVDGCGHALPQEAPRIVASQLERLAMQVGRG